MVTQNLEVVTPRADEEGAVIDRPRVRVLPDGRMPAFDASVYLDQAPRTLEGWRNKRVGPAHVTVAGRIYYYKHELDRFIASGERVSTPGSVERAKERRRRRRQAATAAARRDAITGKGEITGPVGG